MDENDYWRIAKRMRSPLLHMSRPYMLDGNSPGRAPDHKAPSLLLYTDGSPNTGHILISNGGDRIANKFPWM